MELGVNVEVAHLHDELCLYSCGETRNRYYKTVTWILILFKNQDFTWFFSVRSKNHIRRSAIEFFIIIFYWYLVIRCH